jgi:hypothetical protein
MYHRPVIFGIGLNKTGTTTLGHACEQLGFKHLGWVKAGSPDSLRVPFDSRDLMKAWDRGDTKYLVDVARDFDIVEDWPWPLVWREMDEAFPDARFVLTRRSSVDLWLKSQRRHVDASWGGGYRMRAKIYGTVRPEDGLEGYKGIYEGHLAQVRDYFNGSGRLLEVCWDEGDGWPELGGFLGVPVPDVPFPHSNRTGENRPPPPPPWLRRKARKAKRRIGHLVG